jgi:hypothetical protein
MDALLPLLWIPGLVQTCEDHNFRAVHLVEDGIREAAQHYTARPLKDGLVLKGITPKYSGGCSKGAHELAPQPSPV